MSLSDAMFKFKELSKTLTETEQQMMKLMHHPDAKAEHLVEANKIAVRIDQGLRETVTALRKRWKPTDTVFVTPWNRPEFDKYEERSNEEKR